MTPTRIPSSYFDRLRRLLLALTACNPFGLLLALVLPFVARTDWPMPSIALLTLANISSYYIRMLILLKTELSRRDTLVLESLAAVGNGLLLAILARLLPALALSSSLLLSFIGLLDISRRDHWPKRGQCKQAWT